MSGLEKLIARKKTGEYAVVHKFGMDESVQTTYKPVSDDHIYRTPLPAAAIALRIKAGDADDTAAGSGARSVKITGLDASLTEIEETLVTNGTSASDPSTNLFLRLYRITVVDSGTKSDFTNYSHAAEIVVEDTSANEWGKIIFNGIAHGQSQIGCYTVPAVLIDGRTVKECYITDYHITVDTSKSIDCLVFQIQGALETAAPFSPFRIIREHIGVTADLPVKPDIPLGPYPPGTDLGFLAKGATTPQTGVDIEFLLVLES